MAETIDVTPAGEKDVSGSITVTNVLYALHALAPFTMWMLAVVAVIVGMIKRDEVRGTWLDSHYGWLAGTFWWGIGWAVLTSFALIVFGILTVGFGFLLGWLFFLPVTIWYWYRLIRGWLRLSDRKAVGG